MLLVPSDTPAFGKKDTLVVPTIRMHCTSCEAGFVWVYEFVGPKRRYSHGLVLGVDDFAIKKGHTYHTGIHDLKGETLLDLLSGRKLEDLWAYAQWHPHFLQLEPKAVVMDLAKAYHTWISECFPKVIRIADRFHVHGYVIEALQEVRNAVQSTLSP